MCLCAYLHVRDVLLLLHLCSCWNLLAPRKNLDIHCVKMKMPCHVSDVQTEDWIAPDNSAAAAIAAVVTYTVKLRQSSRNMTDVHLEWPGCAQSIVS